MEDKDPEAAARFLKGALTPGKTLDEWLEVWLKQADFKEQTRATYRRAYRELREMLRLKDGGVLLAEDVTDAVAVRYVTEHLPGLGYSAKSMATRLGALSSFWAFLQSRLVVPLGRNPWKGHRLPRRPQDGPRSRASAEERAFTEKELVALLQGTPRAREWEVYPRVRDLLLLGLYTGARLNELASLRCNDLTIHEAEEGRPAHVLCAIRSGKTEAATRTVAVTHPRVLAMLRGRAPNKPPAAQVFHELTPGGPDGKLSWAVSKAFTRYRRECGVPDGTDYHSLRRTFLTLMEHKGVDYVAVARFVGHQVPTMMHAVYSAGASREALLRVADQVRYGPEVEMAVFTA
jgi:integrase